MVKRALISREGKSAPEKIFQILGLSLAVFLIMSAGNFACKGKAVEEEAVQEAKGLSIKEGINDFEGMVKAGLGKYLYIPAVQGFDIVIQGKIDSSDASALVDREVRGKGDFFSQRPAILVADSIEVKESERNWKNVFTRTEDFTADDYLDLKAREQFPALKEISYDKKEGWEGKEKGKVFGRLEKETITQGEEQKDIYRIIILDKENKQAAKIVVDSFTDFAQYYLKKLRLFDNLWFYFTIKDTVDWKTRQVSRELFAADVLYCGLF